MSALLQLEYAETGKSIYPPLGLGNSFSFKLEDQKGHVHRFNSGILWFIEFHQVLNANATICMLQMFKFDLHLSDCRYGEFRRACINCHAENWTCYRLWNCSTFGKVTNSLNWWCHPHFLILMFTCTVWRWWRR